MKLPFFSAVVNSPFGSATAIIFPLLLAACSQHTPQPQTQNQKKAIVEPEIKIIDYLSVNCDRIWQFDDSESMKNPLYWLRAMDCATRLSPAEARAEARHWSAEHWQNTLKQGVLLSNGNVTPVERRQYLQLVDNYSFYFPVSIRPLLQLWHDNQLAQLQLSAERTRFYHLQQTSDEQLDTLRHRQRQLSDELADTRRKLETLTDIERQLSTRKSADVSDNSHGPEAPAAVEADETYIPASSDQNDKMKEAEAP